MSVEEEDSVVLNVEMTLQEKQRVRANISSWEFHSLATDPLELHLYLVVKPTYLQHLKDRKEVPLLNEQQRKRLGTDCLICQEFCFEWITENGSTRDRDQHRGELVLNNVPYRGLQIVLSLGELDVSSDDTIQVKFIYYGIGEDNNYKTFRFTPHPDKPAFQCIIDEKLVEAYSKPMLAMEITVMKEAARELNFRGIQNEGNTCYMNSTLQILYFLRPLRRTILDFEGKSSLMDAIKRVFVELLDAGSENASQGPVNASELLQAYGRFPDPRKQQDIHEFLLGFLDELESMCPQLKELWLGHGEQVLSSREPTKPYNSTLSEEFNELDLPLEDHKGNTLGRLSEALGKLLVEEHVEDKIDTDEYGKVDVTKRRHFSELPKVVFFNLKRYKYRKERNRLVKILTDFEYPASINLGFLQGTPSGGMDEDYVLFGLAVHRGQAYNSGHYFSFVNTSADPEKPYWIKFNDSVVQVSSSETALSFTGGKRHSLGWSREYERFVDREITSEETAYLLVYIRRDKFREYQTIPTPLPRDWLLRKRQADQQRSSKSQNVELLLLQEETGELFEQVNSMPLALGDDEQVHQQLGRLAPMMLGCKVSSLWKVHRQRKKVKQVLNYIDLPQTPARLFDYKRGHSIPDFLLVVPDTHPVYRTLPTAGHERLGIVCVAVREEGGIVRRWRVVAKDSLEDFKAEEERRLGKCGHFEDKDRFVYDWTDHCTINFE